MRIQQITENIKCKVLLPFRLMISLKVQYKGLKTRSECIVELYKCYVFAICLSAVVVNACALKWVCSGVDLHVGNLFASVCVFHQAKSDGVWNHHVSP